MTKELKFQVSKRDIIKKLTNFRNESARKLGVETYKVLQNATIFEIAEKMPKDEQELLKIKGIGEKKLAQFGDIILSSIHGEVAVEKNIDFKEEIFNVSDFLDYINDLMLKESESFKVIGEISGMNDHSTGVYFSLKDKKDESVINCWMPPKFYQTMGIELDDGMEIKIKGYPNIHKPKGRFSFVIESFELAGEGSLKKAYEMLKKKLQEEGLYERKRELPSNITRIGLITSRTSAAIDDFRKNLIARGFDIKFYDARVEGAKAVTGIIKGIKYINNSFSNIDILVITRGGGGLEDLQAFNNELVAREIFASRIPTICAIGHERDVPIANLVGDASVSTPTAAAIRINNSWEELEDYLVRAQQKIISTYSDQILKHRNYLNLITQKLFSYYDKILNRYKELRDFISQEFTELKEKIKENYLKIKNLSDRLLNIFIRELGKKNEKIDIWEKYLASNNPERNLKLGYSIAYNKTGKVIKSIKDVKINENINIDVFDGNIESEIKKIW